LSVGITTHVLDLAAGRPAAGVPVRLEIRGREGWREVGRAATDADGRARSLATGPFSAGVYRLTFDLAAYFAARDLPAFFPEAAVVFEVSDARQHHHVPLLLSPYGYSTYRGS
jgi:hydroxyisourate hydrolase